jgi:heat shock protein HslJ
VTALRIVYVLIAVALVGVLAGCGQTASQDGAALEGVQWTLTASSETGADLADLGISARFDGTSMTGFSGVNTYSGAYTAGDDGAFEAGPFASTMMAGPDLAMAAETAYMKLVDAANKYGVVDGKLTLTTPDGKTLSYEAAPPFVLGGSSWNVTSYNNGAEAVVGTTEGSELSLLFGTDNTVSGSGGVNTFSGPFESDETSIKLGPLASTMMAGADDLMAQEQQYLAALQAARA